MNTFTEYLPLWQDQAITSKNARAIERRMPVILEQLKDFETRQLRLTIIKIVTALALTLSIAWIFLRRPGTSIFAAVGLSLLLGSLFSFLLLYWKKQFRLSALNLDRSASDFLDAAITALAGQKGLFQYYFPIFIIVFTAGFNLLNYDLLSQEDLLPRILFHCGITLFLFLVSFTGMAIRKKLFQRHFQPLIDRLDEIRKGLQQ